MQQFLQTKNNRLEYIDIAKGIGILLVVFGHSSLVLHIENIWIHSFHMPLFIAISGMVYGFCIENLGKYNNSFKFIKNKVVRLLIPFIFFGFFYVAPVMVLCGFTESSYFSYCVNGIILVKNSKLWLFKISKLL